ncbi:MAG: molybdopterin cofactor-binding domain-containing protein [Myxococcota bacterium]
MKITRRGLLISGGIVGGGLLLGVVGIGGVVATYDQRSRQRSGLPEGNVRMVTQWITLSPNGETTLLSPHTEMGQGSHTGLMQIVMDEMDVDPKRMKVVQAPVTKEFAHSDAIMGFLLGDEEMTGWTKTFVEKTFGRLAEMTNLQLTGGSASIRFTGWRGLRRAAAGAREMLAEAGATHLGVPVAEVRTENSTVIHTKSGKRVDYGALAQAAASMPVPENPTFKDPSKWMYIGKRYPRIDLPDKIFAKAVYGIDVEVPGMRYAAVAPPPIALATVTGVENEAELKKRRGVEAVVVLGDAVAVVADNPWRAEQAARAAKLTISPPSGGPIDSTALLAKQRSTLAAGGLDEVHAVGDAAGKLASGSVIEAEYVAPFLAHAPMEPLNATIWSEGGKVHMASGVQGPLGACAGVADALGMSMDDVVFHPHTMGGGFGRRGALAASSMNWLIQTAKVHQAVGGAIKLTWSREADVKLSTFRPSDVAKMRAKLGSDGKPVAWHTQTYAEIGSPAEATPVYAIPNVTIESAGQDPALPYAYWRSVDASTHGFFVECFIDELARAAGQDPVAYRLSLLSDKKRHTRVLKRVAEMSQWSKGQTRPDGSALGVALVESFGSIVAQVAQVSLDDGKPKVHQVWCVIDCGVAINPGSVEAQMQGGIIYGLTAALYGEITVKDGAIVQDNFHNYPIVRFADGPRITVDILTSPDAPVGGAGEPGTPPIAPAVANAIAALKERPRRLPLASIA